MRQQINLYKYLDKKTGFVLTTNFVLVAYALFLIFLVTIHSATLWKRNRLYGQLNKTTNEVSVAQQQLTMLTQQYPVTDPEALKKIIQQLQVEYNEKARLVDLLLPDANFSAYLEGLGNASIPGVWLNQIMFNREEPKITIKGFTLQPVLLEQFFTQLANQPIFSKMIFKLNEVKQPGFPASFLITGRKVNNQ